MIGRDPSCWMQINSMSVSRSHARIDIQKLRPGETVLKRDLYLTSLHPANGTFVKAPGEEEERLKEEEPIPIKSGSTVRLGKKIKLFITHKDEEGKPEVIAAFQDWLIEIGASVTRRGR